MMTPKDTPTTPVAETFVREALDCAHAIDLTALLRDCAVDPNALYQLDTVAFGRVWLALSLAMRDEFFGLGARPMRPGSTTLLGHAICGASTLEVALNRSLRFLRVVLDEPYGTAQVSGQTCTITLTETIPRSAFAYRTFFLILHGFNCWAAKDRIPITSVTFPCPEPAAQNDYGSFFGAPVQFNAPAATLSFNASFLSRRATRSEAELKTFLRSLPEAFLRGYRETGGIKQRIVETCLTGPPRDWPGAATIARQLGLSRSSLHRALSDAGHSLTAIKAEQRQTQTQRLLSRTDLPIAEIAARVGYADESAFYRAFHRWFGTTPGSIRQAK